MTNKFSLQRSSAKTDENENVTTSVFECFTGLSPVEVSYYGIASTGVIVYHEPQNLMAGFNSTQICQLYGGSCVPEGDCTTFHLYGQYRRSKVTCNRTTICCLPERNFNSLYGHDKTSESDVPDLSRRRYRRRRYKGIRRMRRRPWLHRFRRYQRPLYRYRW